MDAVTWTDRRSEGQCGRVLLMTRVRHKLGDPPPTMGALRRISIIS